MMSDKMKVYRDSGKSILVTRIRGKELNSPKSKRKQEHQSYITDNCIRIDRGKLKLGEIRFGIVLQHPNTKSNIKSLPISKTKDARRYISILTGQDVTFSKNKTKKRYLNLAIAKPSSHLSTESCNIDKTRIRNINNRHKSSCKKLSRKEIYHNQFWERYLTKLNCSDSKIAMLRPDFIHQSKNYLTKNHRDIAIESLKLKNMTQLAVKIKSQLNYSLLSCGVGKISELLKYKPKWYGCDLILTNPKNTSQCCYWDGYVDQQNRVSQSKFEHISCGYTSNADVNAVPQNILFAWMEPFDESVGLLKLLKTMEKNMEHRKIPKAPSIIR